MTPTTEITHPPAGRILLGLFGGAVVALLGNVLVWRVVTLWEPTMAPMLTVVVTLVCLPLGFVLLAFERMAVSHEEIVATWLRTERYRIKRTEVGTVAVGNGRLVFYGTSGTEVRRERILFRTAPVADALAVHGWTWNWSPRGPG